MPSAPPSVQLAPPGWFSPALAPARTLTLATCLPQLDLTAVALVLPAIAHVFGLGVAGSAWVTEAYSLAFIGTLLAAGALADRHGRRRMLLAGNLVFAAASLGCGLASNVLTLYATRALQGIAAAFIMTGAIASLSVAGVVQKRVTAGAELTLPGRVTAPCVFQVRCEMDRCVGAAARLPGSERKDLAIQALGRSETVSDLAARHGVSRKFVYQQTHKAVAALDGAFLSAMSDHEVLFELAVTKVWLRQVIVGLTLICRSSYRGVVEFLRDLLGVSISVGCVHDVLQAATREASAVNHDQDLSGIRVGLHDEIFQGATPVLAGIDAASTYCYLLAAEERRDADTWGVHQGLRIRSLELNQVVRC